MCHLTLLCCHVCRLSTLLECVLCELRFEECLEQTERMAITTHGYCEEHEPVTTEAGRPPTKVLTMAEIERILFWGTQQPEEPLGEEEVSGESPVVEK